MQPVKIYLTAWCPYCQRAKALLELREISYEEIDVDGDHATRKWLLQSTGQRTVPQIFIGEESIGGYTELAALDRSGALQAKLEAPVS
ncbi:MAG: glutaredoxin 3 [Myxococcota bacterium]